MTFNIGKLLNNEPYACIPTAIGELCIFSITVGSQIELHKDIAKPIDDCEPTEFVRQLSRHICFPKESLREHKYKPDKPLLSATDVSSLTEEDLEAISKIYVENNEYLSKKLILKTRQNEKGETITHGEYGEIEYPKDKNETFTKYLTRLSAKHDEKQRKQMEEMFGSISGLGSFSRTLGDSIKNTLSWGNSLSKAMESIRPIRDSALLRNVEPSIPPINWAEMEKIREEKRLRPFNELASQLDELIDVSAQSAEFLIEANKIQTGIAGEIKSSGDETTRFAKKNVNLSIVVIVLTVLGMCVALLTAYLNSVDGVEQRQVAKEQVDLLSGKLTDINNSIATQNESLRAENVRLKQSLENQERKIQKMERQLEQQATGAKRLDKESKTK